jgi:hypothetical protein
MEGLLRSADYYIVVDAEGYEPLTLGPITPDASADSVECGLGTSGELTVRVVLDERPIENVRCCLVSVRPLEGIDTLVALRTGVTPEHGELTWQGLRPGTYWVHSATDVGRTSPVAVTVPSGGRAVAVLPIRDDAPAGSLRVSVEDRDGCALSGYEVRAQPITAEGDYDREGVLAFSPEAARAGVPLPPESEAAQVLGRTLISDIVPGVYLVWARVPRMHFRPLLVVVPAGDTVQVEIHEG